MYIYHKCCKAPLSAPSESFEASRGREIVNVKTQLRTVAESEYLRGSGARIFREACWRLWSMCYI